MQSNSYEVTYENIKGCGNLKELQWTCKVGTEILIQGHQEIIFGEVVFVHKDKNILCIEYSDGDFITYEKPGYADDLGGIYIKPLFILEGKAVYNGDTLYWKGCDGDYQEHVVDHLEGDAVWDKTGWMCAEDLTWDKPTGSEEVLRDDNEFKVGDLVRHDLGYIGIVLEVDTNDVFVGWHSSGGCWHEAEFLTKVQDKPEEQKNTVELNLEVKPQVPDDLIKALSNMHNSLGYVLEVLEKYKK